MAISMKSTLVVAVLIIVLVQTADSEPCPMRGKTYTCAQMRTTYYRVATWEKCAKLCQRELRCKAWSWKQPEYTRKCLLHSSECGLDDDPATKFSEASIAGSYLCNGRDEDWQKTHRRCDMTNEERVCLLILPTSPACVNGHASSSSSECMQAFKKRNNMAKRTCGPHLDLSFYCDHNLCPENQWQGFCRELPAGGEF